MRLSFVVGGTVIALMSLVLTVAPSGLAQSPTRHYYGTQPSCYPYYGCQQPAQPVYQPQPYHQPYHAQPHHQPYYPAQKVVAQEIAVAPLIVTVPVESKAVPVHAFGSPYYYSVGEAYREKAYLREVLREELRGLLSGGQQPAPQTPKLPAQPQQPSQPQQPTAPQQPTSWVPDTLTPPDLQQKVVAAFQGKANCISCHGAEAQKFKLVLDDGKGGYVLARHNSDKRWKIYGMASVGAMPPAAASDASKAMEAQHLPNLLQYAAQKD